MRIVARLLVLLPLLWAEGVWASVPLKVPAVPTITSTDYEDSTIILTVSVSDNGGTDITGYEATCTDGTTAHTGTSSSSPITVSGLTSDVAYTCTVTASNSVGTSSASAATDPITPEDSISGLPIWLLYSISVKSGDNDDGVNSYVVTASAGAGGSISPAGERAVAEGGTLSFTLAADSGFSFNRISGSCPSGTTSGTTYTIGAITANCTVVAEFTANNSSRYCAGTPAGVICDPNSDGRRNPGGTMDSWVDGNWGFDNTPIPNGKVVAYPFLANGGASGASGIVQFTNNMGDLTVSGYRWKGWFSESPGGAVLNDKTACRKFSANPNPINMQWSQAANAGSFDCNLGQAERVLYFNMTVGCFEEGRACTVGAPFPGQPGYDSYYVKVYPR